MAVNPNPLVQGVAYGWVNITFMGYSVPLIGVMAINWKKTQKKENIYTTGVDPTYRGYGHKEYEASIEMIWDQFMAIVDASPTGDPLDNPMGDMQVVFGSSRLVNRTVVLQNAEFVTDEMTTKSGDTHLIAKCPLIIAGIVHK